MKGSRIRGVSYMFLISMLDTEGNTSRTPNLFWNEMGVNALER
jgi:hypothetical protein